MTDTEKAALCARIDELCAENERLRQELEGAPRCATCDAMQDCDECFRADASQKERKRLAYENAKLQKVCKEMHDHIKESCDTCDEYYCSSWDEDNECCVFDSYMRELEVKLG